MSDVSDERDGKLRTQIASGRLSSECTAGFEFDDDDDEDGVIVADVDTADCKCRMRDGSLFDIGLLEPREFDDDAPLCDDEQLLGLRECERLVAVLPHGDSEPDRDFFFNLMEEDLEEHSVSDVRRSLVVSYALSGVTTTAALGKLP